MSGGIISGNVTTSRALYGGGVGVINTIIFIMNGGTIRDNEAIVGGGVSVINNSTFTLILVSSTITLQIMVVV